MMRPERLPWWQRLAWLTPVPAYVVVRPDSERLCPDCRTAYDIRDRYCPRCHSAVPEWRFG